MKLRGLIEWGVEHFKVSMLVIWGAIILCLGGVALVSVFSNSNPSATILNISVAPVTATIKLDGDETRNGSYRLEAGIHHIEASADGFEKKSFDIEVKANQTNSVAFYLLNKELGLKYYERSEVEVNLMRVIAKDDESAKDFIKSYDKKFGLIVDVPFKTEYKTPDGYASMHFSDGRSDARCQGTLCIIISGHKVDDASFNGEVYKQLSSRGYNIDDYEVFYEYE